MATERKVKEPKAWTAQMRRIDPDKALETAPPDDGQRQMVEDFREPLPALLKSPAPVLTPEEDHAQRAWLELSAPSLPLNRCELAMKALQDAWHEAQAIEAQQRVPATPAPAGEKGEAEAAETMAPKDPPPENSPLLPSIALSGL